MSNVIRMELHRMFRTRSFYITIALCAVSVFLMTFMIAPMINGSQQTNEVGDVTIYTTVDFSDFLVCPVSFCGELIRSLCGMFLVIFVGCFTCVFYTNGFCKNVINQVKHRGYFQVSKAVCILIYTTVLLAVSAGSAIIFGRLLIKSFTFSYIGEFAKFLLGQWCLLTVVGLFTAFVTELFGSKIPAIVYILLVSSNLIQGILSVADGKLSKWLSMEIMLEKWFPSLYQPIFSLDAPDVSGNNRALLYAVVLSLIFFVIYNIAGSALITKRDVK